MSNAMTYAELELMHDGAFRVPEPHARRIAQAETRLRTEAATVRQCIATYRFVRTAEFAAGFKGRPEALADWLHRSDTHLREARVYYRCAQLALRQLRGQMIVPGLEG